MLSKFRVEGVQRTIQAGQKTKAHDGRNLRRGIESCLQVILRKARYYVPKATRALDGSGRVEFEPGVGLNSTGTVMFGGSAAPYAFVVHERPGVRHAPPTRAYYLSAAVNDTRGTCVSILRRQMRVRQ